MLRRLLCLYLIITLAGCASSRVAQAGTEIFAFDVQRVMVVDPNKGGTSRTLEVNGTRASISQDGRWMAYLATAEGTPSIWIRSLNDSSGPHRITNLPFDSDKIVSHLAWSRDSKQLAFLARFTDEPFREQLGVVEIESGKLEFIAGPVQVFAWSPVDNKLAAFPSGMDSAIGLYLIDPYTDVWNRLCKTCYVESLAWSPDGQQIAFTDQRGNQPNQVTILNVAKKTFVLTLPQPSDGFLGGITWSPNGQDIAFCSSTDSVYVMNVPNERVQKLGEHVYRCVTWSPDGRFIAYVRDDTLVSADKREQMNLVKVSATDGTATTLTEVTPGIDRLEWR